MSDFVWSYVVVPVAIISMVILYIIMYLSEVKNDLGDWLVMRGIPYIAILVFIIYLGSVLLDLAGTS